MSISLYTLIWSIQCSALPIIGEMLCRHTQAVLLSIYRIQTSTKYHFRADNHACTCVIAPVNGFVSNYFTDLTTYISYTSYLYCHGGPGVFYSCFCIASILYQIIVVSCIFTLLEAISWDISIN